MLILSISEAFYYRNNRIDLKQYPGTNDESDHSGASEVAVFDRSKPFHIGQITRLDRSGIQVLHQPQAQLPKRIGKRCRVQAGDDGFAQLSASLQCIASPYA